MVILLIIWLKSMKRVLKGCLGGYFFSFFILMLQNSDCTESTVYFYISLIYMILGGLIWREIIMGFGRSAETSYEIFLRYEKVEGWLGDIPSENARKCHTYEFVQFLSFVNFFFQNHIIIYPVFVKTIFIQRTGDLFYGIN